MRKKINEVKTINNKHEILKQLYDRNLVGSNESIIIASGFENAIIGVSETKGMDFDEAQDWLDAFSLLNNDKENNESVLFVKTLNPALNY